MTLQRHDVMAEWERRAEATWTGMLEEGWATDDRGHVEELRRRLTLLNHTMLYELHPEHFPRR